MRRARWKRKSVCSKLAHRCKFGGNGFCENCCAGEELRTKSRAGCRACPALYAVLIVASNLRVQIGHPLLLFPLPLPRPTPGGVSKGEGPQPRPFVPEGVWGTVASPHVSGGGLRGRDLCAKGPFPLPCSGSYHLREQGKWNVPLWEQRDYPLWLLVPETGTALCGSSLYLLNFCFNSYNSPMASMGVRVSGWQRRMASSTSPSLMASSET